MVNAYAHLWYSISGLQTLQIELQRNIFCQIVRWNICCLHTIFHVARALMRQNLMYNVLKLVTLMYPRKWALLRGGFYMADWFWQVFFLFICIDSWWSETRLYNGCEPWRRHLRRRRRLSCLRLSWAFISQCNTSPLMHTAASIVSRLLARCWCRDSPHMSQYTEWCNAAWNILCWIGTFLLLTYCVM